MCQIMKYNSLNDDREDDGSAIKKAKNTVTENLTWDLANKSTRFQYNTGLIIMTYNTVLLFVFG